MLVRLDARGRGGGGWQAGCPTGQQVAADTKRRGQESAGGNAPPRTCVCPRYRSREREHCIDFTFCIQAEQGTAGVPLRLAAWHKPAPQPAAARTGAVGVGCASLPPVGPHPHPAAQPGRRLFTREQSELVSQPVSSPSGRCTPASGRSAAQEEAAAGACHRGSPPWSAPLPGSLSACLHAVPATPWLRTELQTPSRSDRSRLPA